MSTTGISVGERGSCEAGAGRPAARIVFSGGGDETRKTDLFLVVSKQAALVGVCRATRFGLYHLALISARCLAVSLRGQSDIGHSRHWSVGIRFIPPAWSIECDWRLSDLTAAGRVSLRGRDAFGRVARLPDADGVILSRPE